MTGYYTYLGHDPERGPDGTDLLFTLWDDGTAQLATRPGREQHWVRWSAPLPMTPVSLRQPHGGVL